MYQTWRDVRALQADGGTTNQTPSSIRRHNNSDVFVGIDFYFVAYPDAAFYRSLRALYEFLPGSPICVFSSPIFLIPGSRNCSHHPLTGLCMNSYNPQPLLRSRGALCCLQRIKSKMQNLPWLSSPHDLFPPIWRGTISPASDRQVHLCRCTATFSIPCSCPAGRGISFLATIDSGVNGMAWPAL